MTGMGMGMGGPMGAGRGQSEEDREHRRPSWLIEGDTSIWGDDTPTVPPVIGG
jgi:hypothetical protein